MSFKKQHPMDIVHRCIAIELLRELGAQIVYELNPELAKYYKEVDEENVEHDMYELDYEFLLFECHPYQIEKALKKFEESQPVQKSSLVGMDGQNLTYEKPGKDKE